MADEESSISSATLCRARLGDDDAWKRIWTTYYERVYRQACRFKISQRDAEEVTVDVFRKVWEKLDDFTRSQDGQSLGAWINRITKNVTLDLCRQHQRDMSGLARVFGIRPDEDSSDSISGDLSPIWVAFWEALGIVENECSDRNWECFQMARFAGLPHQEIADKLGMSLTNVSTTANRVYEKIRKQAIEQLNEVGFGLDQDGQVVEMRPSSESSRCDPDSLA